MNGLNETPYPELKRYHKLMIRVPLELHTAIKAEARAQAVTMNDLINSKLKRWGRDIRAQRREGGNGIDPDFGMNENADKNGVSSAV